MDNSGWAEIFGIAVLDKHFQNSGLEPGLDYQIMCLAWDFIDTQTAFRSAQTESIYGFRARH